MPATFKGPQLGKYGTQLGSVVEFYWVPDPVIISQRVLRTRDNLADRTIPLAVSRGIISRDIEENFEGEHDPEGNPWAPWSTAYHPDGERKYEFPGGPGERSYKARPGYGDRLPAGHSGMILNNKGQMKFEATREENYIVMSGRSVNDDSLFLDTAGWPPYWKFHESGTWKMPMRRFLGLSGEAHIQVLEAFETWFISVLDKSSVQETFTSSAGRTFVRRRYPKGSPGGVGGQFMPKQ